MILLDMYENLTKYLTSRFGQPVSFTFGVLPVLHYITEHLELITVTSLNGDFT